MKFLFSLLLLAAGTVYASNVEGKFIDSRFCGSTLLTVKCDFDADPSRRRHLRALAGASGKGGKVENPFKKCTIDGLGDGFSKNLITDPVEDCLVELDDDVHGDNTKIHVYMALLTAQAEAEDDIPTPSLMVKLEVLEKEDTTNGGTVNAYHDFGIEWNCD
jgi:hypothetical protein